MAEGLKKLDQLTLEQQQQQQPSVIDGESEDSGNLIKMLNFLSAETHTHTKLPNIGLVFLNPQSFPPWNPSTQTVVRQHRQHAGALMFNITISARRRSPSRRFSDAVITLATGSGSGLPCLLLFLRWEVDGRHFLALLFTLQTRPKLVAFPAVFQKRVIKMHSAACGTAATSARPPPPHERKLGASLRIQRQASSPDRRRINTPGEEQHDSSPYRTFCQRKKQEAANKRGQETETSWSERLSGAKAAFSPFR